MAALDHPLKPVVESLRTLIRAVSPTIGEAIKWNSPSFYTTDHFATINIGRRTKARPTDHVLVILHRGAKAKPAGTAELVVDDPANLLEPLGTDRYAVAFHSAVEVKAKGKPFQNIIRQWIGQL